MNCSAAIFGCLLALAPLAMQAQPPTSPNAAPRLAAPRNLLDADFRWEPQSGKWEVGTASATGSSGETLAELTAARDVSLPGRWLTLKVALSGDATKAGIWFSGVRDERGEILRFVVDAASDALTNGRGKTLAQLGHSDAPTELLFQFTREQVTVHRGSVQLAEVPVTYSEGQATMSLFVERGTAVFQDLLLSGEGGGAHAMEAPVEAPRRVARPAAKAAAAPLPQPLVADFSAADMVSLKSTWNDYFGIHFQAEPGPWKTVRHYDGPEFGLPPRGRHAGEVTTYDGPFSKTPVQISLANFRDWKRKDARGLDENLAKLIEEDRAAVFIAPWAAAFTPAQQDQVWALMKRVYGANVGAEGRIFFQWGDEINYRRLGVAANTRVSSSQPRGGVSPQRGGNLPADAVAYAENYFAPAVEAVRHASEEIFRNPRQIPILLGSCVRASDPANRAWYSRVLEHELAGTSAPTLKGKKVVELVDYLTVNYPFFGGADATGLQELWDRYGRQVKGLWVTEEYGTTGRSGSVLLHHAAQYLEWVAANQLDAQQTRLLWHLPEQRRDPQDLHTFVRQLGTTLEPGPLRIGQQATETGRLYRLAAGEGRMLLINLPSSERRGGKRTATIGEIVFTPPAGTEGRPWIARLLEAKGRRFLANELVLPVGRKDGRLIVETEASALEPWAMIIESP